MQEDCRGSTERGVIRGDLVYQSPIAADVYEKRQIKRINVTIDEEENDGDV